VRNMCSLVAALLVFGGVASDPARRPGFSPLPPENGSHVVSATARIPPHSLSAASACEDLPLLRGTPTALTEFDG
jgi:hypothetical protein